MIKEIMRFLSLVIQGLPSKKLQADMSEQEESRVQKQKEKLGEAGLAKKQAELASAMEMKEASAPDSLLTSLPIPSSYSILFNKVTFANTNQLDNLNLKQMPVFFQFDQNSSIFVNLSNMLNKDMVLQALKPYQPLLLEPSSRGLPRQLRQLWGRQPWGSGSRGVGSHFLPRAFTQYAVSHYSTGRLIESKKFVLYTRLPPDTPGSCRGKSDWRLVRRALPVGTPCKVQAGSPMDPQAALQYQADR